MIVVRAANKMWAAVAMAPFKNRIKFSLIMEQIIIFIRVNGKPLITAEEASAGMNYLLGRIDKSLLKNLFSE